MAIVRLCAVDPRPNKDRPTDVLVYQVPEKSREMELLCELFDSANVQWVVIPPEPRKPKP